MPRDERLVALVPRLAAATYFEEAATAVLESMFGAVDQALTGSAYDGSARLLRGVLHLRPHGSYQRLYGVEYETLSRVEGAGYVTSGNVWRWIEEHRCSVSIDVQLASLRSWLTSGPLESREHSSVEGVPGNATRERMLGREATHVHVVPLCVPEGAVHGVVTLEMNCKSAIGREFVWGRCVEELEILARIAGAFVVARDMPTRLGQSAGADEFLPVVGKSTAHLIEVLRAFAPRADTVLISGPTGVGKSRLARWCHENSTRKGQRFEQLDLLGVPEELQMAELFGWKRGAFTGAVRDTVGAVARAEGGTLFLDEIDKLSLKAQAGLLRFIEERSYRMLGDDSLHERRADVRLLVGTNADLRGSVKAGRFREDLYYRINVLPIRLLPLSERTDELSAWAEYMLARRHRETGAVGPVCFEPEALKILASADWPGNLRQLDNLVRRAYALVLGDSQESGHVVRARHVERALRFDSETAQDGLVELLWRAARAFVQEADKRRNTGRSFDLDLSDAFRGMVLGAALEHTGNRDEAFELLGQQPLLKNRNHYRALRRELSKVRGLLGVLGAEVDRNMEAIFEGNEDVTSER